MQIIAMPLLQDNYGWLLLDPNSNDCAIVDPSEGEAVEAILRARKLTLKTILATHHHPDHVDGIPHLFKPGIEVISSRYDKERVPHVTRLVDDRTDLRILGQPVHCLMVPGHTLGAVAYHFTEAHALFTGDTLFLGGCGRLFEGSPAQMHASLSRLGKLPPQTQIYCGHEYTQKNLEFAAHVEPSSTPVRERLNAVRHLRDLGKPTVPATLQVEAQTNPFLRAVQPELQHHFAARDALETFTKLREARNQF